MTTVNNVDLDKISKTTEGGKNDPSTLKKPVKLHGAWNLDSASEFQFSTELPFENGKQRIEVDSPSFLGGNGNRLGPMGYCIAGITSCFIGTFASVSASSGVTLTKLQVDTLCSVNFAKSFDVSDEPLMDVIKIEIDAVSDNADSQKLQELVELAKQKCPAMYSMSHTVNVDAHIK